MKNTTDNVITLNFEENLLNQYVKLEQKARKMVEEFSSQNKIISLRGLAQINHYLSNLKVCLEMLEEERVEGKNQDDSKENHINRQIDARKFHLINSMEKILSLLKNFGHELSFEHPKSSWIPKVVV